MVKLSSKWWIGDNPYWNEMKNVWNEYLWNFIIIIFRRLIPRVRNKARLFTFTTPIYCFIQAPNQEGHNRGWDGWMASPTQWTWVWINSGSWWWTGRPGMLQSMGLQRVGHDWATELTELSQCKKTRKGMKIYIYIMEKKKWNFLFLGDMMVCMENTKESTNTRTRRKIGTYTGLI